MIRQVECALNWSDCGNTFPCDVTAEISNDVINKLNSEIAVHVSPLFQCVGLFKLFLNSLNVCGIVIRVCVSEDAEQKIVTGQK